ncbi:uncharacterized protein PG998_004042 [Apiospora kogelbergensis]|uniref:HPP transmembrane region domain-containing protein n=1 Tax=Apiospora kogelbergensis TaxID=1337665 RepID=A0AAW0QIU0_9PEZI
MTPPLGIQTLSMYMIVQRGIIQTITPVSSDIAGRVAHHPPGLDQGFSAVAAALKTFYIFSYWCFKKIWNGTRDHPTSGEGVMVENVLLGFSLGKVVSHHDAVQFRLCSLMDVGGATAVCCSALPKAPLAQPRAILEGHFFSALIGVIVARIFRLNDLDGGESY